MIDGLHSLLALAAASWAQQQFDIHGSGSELVLRLLQPSLRFYSLEVGLVPALFFLEHDRHPKAETQI